MLFLPDKVRPNFAMISAGYLSADRSRLLDMRERLSPLGARTLREGAIIAAIQWQIEHWRETLRLREPLVFTKRTTYV